ncbi:MAG: hypothetical protein A2842_02790 [Candidatus Wildermuthbacteria bacterium RIFCSPHIGHO2_01_FULL_48_25]|uniref:AI-2E family transporter n=1 Tax=Candidatus Wildermuthbacteria bacterium RIFCSPLOWO2_01_FULL_48_16 TaxID=1802461 RepID=A0A1G2RKL5_9BACT|nr:MAG: hypothetical protein A2842_02790 [Candidatus Wildermuthbacteria bacterium RIFCSPHIGHO2_01_FULL_48_25]OHA68181.1 MAG: hypothetical protein A3J57_02155 [Candidatus Wildermuthbacteria bacterium RIFCSPHIGHO2_02_FULL_49_12b]OHA73028.1 MAG: hypothetical protein A3B24_01275 [Candidatus Wildermuthbacteria bacterium RIFCSPLOWO2_01_FULL_48_16]
MTSLNERTLDISWGTIVKLSLATLLIYIVFLLKDVLVWFVFGVIISILFDPVIDVLEKFRIPRVVATVGMYLLVFGVVAFILYGTAPLFINEIKRFSQLIPQYFETLAPSLRGLGLEAFSEPNAFVDASVKGVEKFGSNFFSALFAIFGGIVSTLFVISIAIFLSLERKGIERAIMLLFPRSMEVLALDVWTRSQKKVSAWFISRIVGSLFVGVATYITLFLFGAPYPFSLSLLSGVTNFLPIIGPLFSGAIVVFLLALESLPKALFVGIALFLIQQIEGNILTPLLTKKFIGLSPVLVLVAVAVGGTLWGVLGALFAIPIAGILSEFLRDFLKKRKGEVVVT